jgi:hypothetical protein
MCRSSIGWSDTHHPLISRNHTDSSNPIASAGVVCGQTGTFKTPVFWRLARLEKRLDLGIATRNATPHSAMYRASMGATDGQRNWPNMRKTFGKPRFFSGEDRNRTTREIHRKIDVSKRGVSTSDARINDESCAGLA